MKRPLEYLYGNILGASSSRMKTLKHFFKDILSVQDASWRDIVKVLEILKYSGCEDMGHIREFYEYLAGMETIPCGYEVCGLILRTKLTTDIA